MTLKGVFTIKSYFQRIYRLIRDSANNSLNSALTSVIQQYLFKSAAEPSFSRY